MAFVDIGDQFLALSEGRTRGPDTHRHFGLVVDNKEAVRAALVEAGVEISRGRSLDFRDPWGNRVEVVDYRDVQFTKAPWGTRAHGSGPCGKWAERSRPATKRDGFVGVRPRHGTAPKRSPQARLWPNPNRVHLAEL